MAFSKKKTKKAMKGGKACGIHRAMKYTSVDPRTTMSDILSDMSLSGFELYIDSKALLLVQMKN